MCWQVRHPRVGGQPVPRELCVSWPVRGPPPQALIEHVMLWHAVGRAALHLSLKFSIIVVTDWQGVPSLGVTIQPTENPAFKAKHGILDGERQGVVVTKVCLNQHRVAACAVAAQSLTRVR